MWALLIPENKGSELLGLLINIYRNLEHRVDGPRHHRLICTVQIFKYLFFQIL